MVASEQSILVADNDEYVKSVLRKALGDDKANLLIDRILQGSDISGIESLKWMDARLGGRAAAQRTPADRGRDPGPPGLRPGQLGVLKTLHRAPSKRDHGAHCHTRRHPAVSALKDLNDVMSKVLAGGEKLRKTSLGGAKTRGRDHQPARLVPSRPRCSTTSARPTTELAQKIMDNMFTFDDLEKIDDKGIQALLKEVQSESLVIALKGATPEMREKVFKNMSTRAAETLREDLESRGPVRVSEVEAEQKEMLKIVRRLADEGRSCSAAAVTMTSSKQTRNVPPPQGSSKPASLYSRFIPREELDSFAAWTPGALSGDDPAVAPFSSTPRAPAEPAKSAEQEQAEQLSAARQGGYHDGYRDGIAALESFKQSFAAQMTAQIGALMQSYASQMDGLQQDMARTLAGAATALARQVVRSELLSRPEQVATVAQEALETLLLSARHITVRVHPDDHVLVARGAADVLAARGARLLADAAVSRGGCIVESDIGIIDGSIETRWRRAAAALGSEEAWPTTRPHPSPLPQAGEGARTPPRPRPRGRGAGVRGSA